MSPELLTKIQQASIGASSTSLRALLEDYVAYSERTCSSNTLPARISRLRRFYEVMTEAGIIDVSQVNNAVLNVYFDTLTSKVTSANATRMVIKSFLAWVESYKEIDTPIKFNAIKTERQPKRKPKYLLEDKIEQVLQDGSLHPVDRLLISCAFRMGLRVSELSDLRLCDLEGDELTVIGKGDAERTVIVPGSVHDLIDNYVKIAPYHIESMDHVFQSFWREEWRQMTPKTIWKRTKKVFQRILGIDISPHWLRRSYAVDLLLKGCDIMTVKQSLGHTDLKVTQIYAELADSEMKSQIHKFLG